MAGLPAHALPFGYLNSGRNGPLLALAQAHAQQQAHALDLAVRVTGAAVPSCAPVLARVKRSRSAGPRASATPAPPDLSDSAIRARARASPRPFPPLATVRTMPSRASTSRQLAGRWTVSENEAFIAAVEGIPPEGPHDWEAISRSVRTRSVEQVRLHASAYYARQREFHESDTALQRGTAPTTPEEAIAEAMELRNAEAEDDDDMDNDMANADVKMSLLHEKGDGRVRRGGGALRAKPLTRAAARARALADASDEDEDDTASEDASRSSTASPRRRTTLFQAPRPPPPPSP